MEYEATIHALKISLEMDVRYAELYIDSKLLANQFEGTYESRDDRMVAYLEVIQTLARKFTFLTIIQKSRYDICHADALAYLTAVVKVDFPRSIAIELQQKPSIDLPIDQLRERYLSTSIFWGK